MMFIDLLQEFDWSWLYQPAFSLDGYDIPWWVVLVAIGLLLIISSRRGIHRKEVRY
jgi:hypothetical protein